ncbi:hypothetical protein [Nocardia tengchongensis]
MPRHGETGCIGETACAGLRLGQQHEPHLVEEGVDGIPLRGRPGSPIQVGQLAQDHVGIEFIGRGESFEQQRQQRLHIVVATDRVAQFEAQPEEVGVSDPHGWSAV